MSDHGFLDIAIEASRLAGEVILNNLGKLSSQDIHLKKTSDFVTYVDKASEQSIIKTIREHYPHHKLLAEESIKEAGTQDYLWIIDPLDGTTNYIHGYPVFSVSIALHFDNDAILGVVFDPLRNDLFSAEKGKGAYLNGNALAVSSVDTMKDSLIATGFPFRNKHLTDQYLRLFKQVFHKVSDLRRSGSAALDLAYLACGKCDGFFEIGLSPWDMAAGCLIVKEAGGVVTDFRGGPNFLTTGNIVAGNTAIHHELLKDVVTIFNGLFNG